MLDLKGRKSVSNEKGLTLIELLASIVIIAIVLTSFLSLLLQATKHTKYNEEKLTEVDIAEEIVGEIRNGVPLEDLVIPPAYQFEVNCADGPPNMAKLQVIVKSLSARGQKKSPFETEMYVHEDYIQGEACQ